MKTCLFWLDYGWCCYFLCGRAALGGWFGFVDLYEIVGLYCCCTGWTVVLMVCLCLPFVCCLVHHVVYLLSICICLVFSWIFLRFGLVLFVGLLDLSLLCYCFYCFCLIWFCLNFVELTCLLGVCVYLGWPLAWMG